MTSSTGKGREELPTMGLLGHLDELRRRIVYSLIALFVAVGICWAFTEQIFEFLARPIYAVLPEGEKLAFLGVTDPLFLYLKVALLAAIFLASPFLLYQIYAFVAPGLYQRERRWVVPFVVAGCAFFVGGGAFAYYVAFPFSVKFLLSLGDQFHQVITIDRYFRFMMTIVLGLGLMFELPVMIFLLSSMGVVKPRFLIKQFRWAVLLIFIAAAIITPTPDIFNLCLFALPTIALYLLGVGVSALVVRGKRKRREAAAEETSGDLAES